MYLFICACFAIKLLWKKWVQNWLPRLLHFIKYKYLSGFILCEVMLNEAVDQKSPQMLANDNKIFLKKRCLNYEYNGCILYHQHSSQFTLAYMLKQLIGKWVKIITSKLASSKWLLPMGLFVLKELPEFNFPIQVERRLNYNNFITDHI